MTFSFRWTEIPIYQKIIIIIRPQTLNILEINVNSIISNEKRASLSEHLKRHKPDVILFYETKLNNKHKIQFRDYTFIRNDRPNAKQSGGTGILIRSNVKFNNIQTDYSVNPTFETILKLKL